MTALVIAPHPDDEVFGCGGLINRIKSEGGKVFVLFITVGTTKDFSSKGESTAEGRIAEIERVAKILSFDGYKIALPGNDYHLRLDAVPQKELIHVIERGDDISLETINPDIVLTPNESDYNQDHRAIYYATMTAVRPASQQFKSFQPLVLTYELPYQEWNVLDSQSMPNMFIRLEEEDMSAKLAALECYKSQIKSPESPLSAHGVKALASYHGLQCGCSAAEAYHVKRLTI